MIRSMKIKRRLTLGFSIIIIFVMIMSFLGIYETLKISKATSDLYEHSYMLSNLVKDIQTTIVEMHRDMKDVTLSRDDHELDQAIAKVQDGQEFVLNRFDSIYQYYTGDRQIINESHNAFINWKPIRSKVIALKREGKIHEAAEITKHEGAEYIRELDHKIDKLILTAEDNADKYYQISISKKKISVRLISIILALILTASIFISIYLSRTIISPIYELQNSIKNLAEGYLNESINISGKDEIGELAHSVQILKESMIKVVKHAQKIVNQDFKDNLNPRSDKDELVHSLNKMTEFLKKNSENNLLQHWKMSGRNELHHVMGGNQDLKTLSNNILDFIATYLGAKVGTFFLLEEDNLNLTASYACLEENLKSNTYKVGEAVVGQVVQKKQIQQLDDVPDNYLNIATSLGSVAPSVILVVPIMREEEVVGVIELGFIKQLAKKEKDFLIEMLRSAAVAIIASQSREKMHILLTETQTLAEELQVQQEELRAANEELEHQTEALKLSSERLKEQQEELQTTNEELEEKTQFLEEQSNEIKKKNEDLEVARNEVELKALDLERVSKYKSEFLANMSHELRTPLNSLLILSRDLADNKDNNLTDKQLQSSEIIHKCGSDLLLIINDILDLSKVEAGQMEAVIEDVQLIDIEQNIRTNFEHQCELKNLNLDIRREKKLPDSINTDLRRLDQILKNLISNAIKFTTEGNVEVAFLRRKIPESHNISDDRDKLCIMVSDSGIGIPVNKQKDIFEAFRQADGSTSRKYGGTGLGLSISRELANLLDGHLLLESSSAKGSVFAIYLPCEFEDVQKNTPMSIENTDSEVKTNNIIEPNQARKGLLDDRENLDKFSHNILVIEDDLEFAKILRDFCHSKSFGFLHAVYGLNGIDMMRRYQPDGVLLDVMLPVMDGWQILRKIQSDERINNIPVHMLSASETTIDAKSEGAIGFMQKPAYPEKIFEAFNKINEEAEREIKKILLVDDDKILNELIVELFNDQNISFDLSVTGKIALEKLSSNNYDLMILDLNLPDFKGRDLIEAIIEKMDINIPIIVYTGSEVSEDDEFQLRKYTNSIIVKGLKSHERLLDETALFLHQVEDNQKDITPGTKLISSGDNEVLKGKKVLVVDDDMRNVFAVSHVLENIEMEVLRASNGKKAIEVLESGEKVDLVLMDIMMPVMDGYEAMQKIRAKKKYKNLPIIALTAKAMRGDRDKCIDAGANDYCPKPLNVDRLLSLMKVWLY